MWAYTMVEPTNLKPRFLRSLLSASDSGLVAGTCFMSVQRLTIGRPPTKDHRWASRLPISSWSFSTAFALPIADSILSRLRTMPGNCISFSTRRLSKRATRSTSKSAKASR
jgi:hypothetical protein